MRVYWADENREPDEVRITPKVQVMVEHHFDTSIVDLGRVEHVYFMGWAALKAAGKDPGEFDAFLEQIEDVERVEAQEVGPTSPGPSPDSSLS